MQEAEFISLVQKNERIIYKVVSLYTDTVQDKEDLFQETLLQLWKSSNRFNGESSFTTWVYRIALNVALNFKRNSKQKVNLDPINEVSLLKAEAADKEEYEILYLIIKHLNDADKLLITLHLDGYSHEEIGEIAGISKNYVNVKIFRIKEQISTMYKNIGNGY
jgi:RNA polymerase sigma factor (sigma-70 family)